MRGISSNCAYNAGIFLIIFSVTTVILLSCSKGGDDNFVYPKGDTTSKTTTLKPRYLWIDAAGNFTSYANSKENIAADLKLAYDAGFTDIVVDVRPAEGDVLFKTSAEQQVTKLDVWEGSSYHFYARTATWDYLQAFIDAGHENNALICNQMPYCNFLLTQRNLLCRREIPSHNHTSANCL